MSSDVNSPECAIHKLGKCGAGQASKSNASRAKDDDTNFGASEMTDMH
jgi:hypothetical protein